MNPQTIIALWRPKIQPLVDAYMAGKVTERELVDLLAALHAGVQVDFDQMLKRLSRLEANRFV